MTISLYEDLLDGVEEDLGDFLEQINNEIRRIAGMLNSAASGIGGFIDDILPGDTVDRAIERWNDEIHPWILEMCEQVYDNVWDAVGDLAGRPQNLIDYAADFSSVKATIYREGDLAQKMVIFNHDWQGYAAENYRVVATTEDAALRDLSLAMDAGATLTTNVATRILTLWRELASQFARLDRQPHRRFKVATEADSIITFEIPAAFELAKAIWENIVDARRDLRGLPDRAGHHCLHLVAAAGQRGPRSPPEQVADGRGGQQRRHERPRQLDAAVRVVALPPGGRD